ncbi:hypothetical protein GY45DRAFT_1365322, partial [Cubamyces sp. BRFM 1775]
MSNMLQQVHEHTKPRRSGSKLVPHARLDSTPQRQRSRLVSTRSIPASLPSTVPSAPPPFPIVHPPPSASLDVTTAGRPFPLVSNAAQAPPLLADEHTSFPGSATVEDQEMIEDYWFALHATGSIFRIEDAHYVLQEWDSKAKCLKIGVYCHLIQLPHGPQEVGTVCTCPGWKAHNTCLHLSVVLTYTHILSTLRLHAPSPIPPAVFLCATSFCEAYVFSCVSATSQYESGKRVIVVLQRDGRWHCDSCRYADSCKHKPHAQALAAKIGCLPEPDDIIGTLIEGEHSRADAECAVLLAAGTQNNHRHGCISHMKILPPRWCALPSENIPATSALPIGPTHLRLDALSRCACGTSIQAFPDWQVQVPIARSAILFGSHSRHEVNIDVIPCPVCHHRRRFIGPDLGVLAILNLNNEYLFTHELLNSYTNAFTASETPFSAFCLTLRRLYEDTCPGLPFC